MLKYLLLNPYNQEIVGQSDNKMEAIGLAETKLKEEDYAGDPEIVVFEQIGYMNFKAPEAVYTNTEKKWEEKEI